MLSIDVPKSNKESQNVFICFIYDPNLRENITGHVFICRDHRYRSKPSSGIYKKKS